MLYRLTIYENDRKKTVDEFDDEDDLRESVENAMNDIENQNIKTFSVSWISDKTYQKPFWES